MDSTKHGLSPYLLCQSSCSGNKYRQLRQLPGSPCLGPFLSARKLLCSDLAVLIFKEQEVSTGSLGVWTYSYLTSSPFIVLLWLYFNQINGISSNLRFYFLNVEYTVSCEEPMGPYILQSTSSFSVSQRQLFLDQYGI